MRKERQSIHQNVVATLATFAIHSGFLIFFITNLNVAVRLQRPNQAEIEPVQIAILEEIDLQTEEEAALLQAKQKAEEAKQQAIAQAKKRQAEEEAALLQARQKAEEAKQQAIAAEEGVKIKAEQETMRKATEAHQLALKLAIQEKARNYAENVIATYVEQRWNPMASSHGGLLCLLRITVTSSGQVTNVQIVQGSGDNLFDNSAVAAAQRASPLPMPGAPEVAQALRPTFILRFRPIN